MRQYASRSRRPTSTPVRPSRLRTPPFTSSTNLFRHALRRTNRSTARSEEHTSELQSRGHLVCRLLLEKKNNACHTGRRVPAGSYMQPCCSSPALPPPDRYTIALHDALPIFTLIDAAVREPVEEADVDPGQAFPTSYTPIYIEHEPVPARPAKNEPEHGEIGRAHV